MKLVKMSLAAAVLLGASAFAIDNVKVSGDAKLFYGTDNHDQVAPKSDSMFGQDNSYADTALRLGVTGDLTKGVSFGATGYAVSTLGLEKNLVANTWTGAHDNTAVGDNAWLGELWLAATLGKTTAKVGRMELDTPLAFSEKWSIVPNTFEAAVLINQDIPDTTLVGAWVGNSNGRDAANAAKTGAARDGIMRIDANFGTFAANGAYAAAVVNNSLKFLTAQAWYYNVVDVADAYWLQADWDCQLIKGVKVGVQYADMSPKGVAISPLGLNLSDKDSKAVAVKIAYAADALNVSAAYSDRNKDGDLRVQNVAGSGQSKLYTESYWSYGYVGAADATAWNLTAEYDLKGLAKLGAYYTNVNTDWANKSGDLSEVAVTASKSFGPLDTTLAYINTKANDVASYNTLQAYLTLNF
jgi:hypothetical protein